MKKALDDIIDSTFRLQRILRKHLFCLCTDKHPLHPMQLHALHFIIEKKQPPMNELAAMLRIALPSATALVNRLVSMKLVQRKTDPENRRRVLLSITPAGRRMLEEKKKHHRDVMGSIFNVLSADDQKTFARILCEIVDKNAKM